MTRTYPQAHRLSVPEDAVMLLRYDFDRHSLSTLRREVGRCGRADGLDDRTLSNFVLAVNEIATNAVRYAGGRGQLALWCEHPWLWCEVVDDGPGIPQGHLDQSHWRRKGHVGGHGLWLARQICDRFEIETGQLTGTRVLMAYRPPLASPGL